MNIDRRLGISFDKIGRIISLKNGDEVYEYMAVVQPIHDKSKLYLESGYSSLGKLDKSHALYYGPALYGGENIKESSLIVAGNITYAVKICEEFFYKDKTIYIWAVLQRSFDEEVIT